ncbi:copper amine oxidase N-terminal domain-containing protein [Lysinibacillus xylanilyticus]|uniref:copper amine oxidase N-terminal domain-containing protein n=1 Tax=Lysinibacillus xylanilyticus TaxID=582475 RepID=UPI002B24688B|nr:copper amine oxidase N-terminal domain-containing protein [Lysinibacillus xylanilyticus]MEB2299089.1 copper amine oxidase N-terminal domain-containing protein [Lysinibacillus xylanilyticus]
MKKHILSLFLVMFAMIGFASTSHASSTINLESGNTHSNTLTSSNESQWYQINTKQDNSDLNIYLENTTAPIRFSLYDSNKNLIAWNVSSSFQTLKAGTYYIEVNAYDWGNSYSSGSYEIKATYSSGNVTHDSTTFEPNDTRENAFPIQSGKKISSLISNNNDVDFYKFTTTVDNGDVYIYLANTSAPIKFNLYDSNKNLIASANSSLFKPLKAGTYYIEVNEFYWDNHYSSGTYDLIATYSTNSKEHNPSTFEPNDTLENAFPIKSNAPIKSQMSNSNDIDFYSITLNKEGNVNISLSNTSAPARFKIYDANKKLLDYSSQSYSKYLAAGTYYIEVYADYWGDQYSSGTYTLTAGYPNAITKSNEILLYLNSKTTYVNGKNKTLAVAPFTKKETTLVPLRFVSEELGAKVNWNPKNNEITVQLNGSKIVLNTESYYVTVNGSGKILQVKPEVINGTTFVPLRFVSEQLGKTVLWNAKNKSILIK